MYRIKSIKLVIAKHVKNSTSKSIANFIHKEYKSDVRKMFENMKISPVKICPPGKILNPVSGRCVNIDGKIGKKIKKI
jgi:hypothetical protein